MITALTTKKTNTKVYLIWSGPGNLTSLKCQATLLLILKNHFAS